jgi:chorismate dehydratase
VTRPVRLGAVGYLNARPLTWALDRAPDRWDIRYDLPAVCADLLYRGEVDLGLVPSIDYLRAPDYRLVPGVGVVSRGPVASVALFSRVPIEQVTSIALDTSSHTSVALTKVLCRRRFHIDPVFVAHGPDLEGMTRECDAGLLIGDPALDADPEKFGLHKIDLGEEWTAMTGLPFVYAAWTGRPGAATEDDVRALQAAQQEGMAATKDIAAEYGRGNAAATARAAVYLRDNVKHGLGPSEAQGLQAFLDLAVEVGAAPRKRVLEFF